ncbi:glycosyltransferase family 4 protein [Cohnella mopanensis]|uniref:glycosyltransferase family 4 protein n=1 Tax=Cohnella mopanensis TaxID=2911966 RepID=UPI001EF7CA52|nr:glycosyltransferase family 4 protein [Cohnella mopanensis]
MKILLATYWHIPHLGGVWTYMEQLKTKLESLGHEVDLLGYGDEAVSFVHFVNTNQQIQTNKLLPLLQTILNEKDYPMIHKNSLVKYTEFRRYAFELAVAYLGLDSYDIIHTQDVISTACINRIRPSKPALVASLHGCVAHDIRLQLKTIHKSNTSQMAREYFDRQEYIGATSAEYTILANEWMKNILTDEFKVPGDKLQVIHYGYDIESFMKKTKLKSKAVRPPNKKVILYAGRLVELKGIQYLLDALKLLKDKRKDWVCWIVGDGKLMTELRLQSKVQGLTNEVVFMGRRDDVPALLSQTDIFVLPSLHDNQPMSIIEAQLAGKAIIASEVGGVPEMVKHRVTGLLTPARDSEKLMNRLLQLLEKDSLRKKLGDEAKQWAMNHWSMDSSVERILDVYQNAITVRSRRSDV